MSRRPTPLLDSRTEEDILRQMKKLALINIPEWKGWDSSGTSEEDLGVSLARVFARYAKIVIDRLNMAPERNLLAFMNLLGASRRPPQPATAPLRFTLVKGRNLPVYLPAGTLVAAEGTDTSGKPILFETQNAITVLPVLIKAAMSINPRVYKYTNHRNGSTEPVEQLGSNDEKPFIAFKFDKTIDRTIYIGCNELLTLRGIKALKIDLKIAPVKKELSPRVVKWERWDGEAWKEITEVADGTKGLLKSGTVELTVELKVDEEFPLYELNGISSRWIRAHLSDKDQSREPVVIKGITCSVTREFDNQPLTSAFANSNPIDVSREYLPFGLYPKLGDIFYFAASDSLLAGKGVIELDVKLLNDKEGELRPVCKSHKPSLSWEHWNGSTWISIKSVDDDTSSLTTDGRIKLTIEKPTAPLEFQGYHGIWFRARLASGNYGGLDKYRPKKKDDLKAGLLLEPEDLSPPFLSSITISCDNTTLKRDPDALIVEDDLDFKDVSALLKDHKETLSVFGAPVDTDPFLCLGLACAGREGIAGQTIELQVGIDDGIDEKDSKPYKVLMNVQRPELIWEYLSSKEDGWKTVDIEDETSSLGESGALRLRTPSSFEAVRAFGRELFWIRARLPQTNESQPEPVKINFVSLNTVMASNSRTHVEEVLGSSNGSEEQFFRTTHSPILTGQVLEVRETITKASREIDLKVKGKDEQWTKWREVSDFYGSGPENRHYTLNRENDTVHFGDGKNGMIPPRGLGNIRMKLYHSGGGVSGNQPEWSISKLKTGIPYIGSVCNILPSRGGSDSESMEDLIDRIPRQLQHQGRAVTRDDYENLAKLASPEVARAKSVPLYDLSSRDALFDAGCIRTPGVVSLIVLPNEPEEPKPEPSSVLLKRVQDFIEPRMPPGVKLVMAGPCYAQVDINVEVVVESLSQSAGLTSTIQHVLRGFLHPLTGGDEGYGWRFGSQPRKSDIYALLEDLPGVIHINELTFPLQDEKLPRNVPYLIYAGDIQVEMKSTSLVSSIHSR